MKHHVTIPYRHNHHCVNDLRFNPNKYVFSSSLTSSPDFNYVFYKLQAMDAQKSGRNTRSKAKAQAKEQASKTQSPTGKLNIIVSLFSPVFVPIDLDSKYCQGISLDSRNAFQTILGWLGQIADATFFGPEGLPEHITEARDRLVQGLSAEPNVNRDSQVDQWTWHVFPPDERSDFSKNQLVHAAGHLDWMKLFQLALPDDFQPEVGHVDSELAERQNELITALLNPDKERRFHLLMVPGPKADGEYSPLFTPS